jgi:hypothetical protein
VTATQRGTALAAGVLLLAGAFLTYPWWSQRQASELSVYLPKEAGSVISIDVAQLRRIGLLGGKDLPWEAEYRSFITATSFDFERDLDQVLLHLGDDKNVYLASGRFHWPKLRQYVLDNGGKCVDRACSIASSQQGKYLSYFPLGEGAIAVALAKDEYAAAQVTPRGAKKPESCAASLELRGEEVRRWLPFLGEVANAKACVGNDALMTLVVALANADSATKADAGFRTLAAKLNAKTLVRKDAEFHLEWELKGESLAALFGGAE